MTTESATKHAKGEAELIKRENRLLTEVCPRKVKHILVPIDFSECSRNALRYAVPVAERFGARLILLCVIETTVVPPELGYMRPELQQAGIHSARAALEELAQRTEKALGTHFVWETQVRHGIPWQEITIAAQALEVDLVVLSTHGYTGIKQIVMGSTAERVVQHAACPVLVVPESDRNGQGAPRAGR